MQLARAQAQAAQAQAAKAQVQAQMAQVNQTQQSLFPIKSRGWSLVFSSNLNSATHKVKSN